MGGDRVGWGEVLTAGLAGGALIAALVWAADHAGLHWAALIAALPVSFLILVYYTKRREELAARSWALSLGGFLHMLFPLSCVLAFYALEGNKWQVVAAVAVFWIAFAWAFLYATKATLDKSSFLIR